MTIAEDIAKAEKEAAAQSSEADRLKNLAKAYPDLKKYVGRWNKVAYYSKTVNTKVDRFDMRHNCGCCSDSPLEVWPYLETPDGNIYSDPPSFCVGERDPAMCGDRPNPGWKTTLQNAGIPEDIIGAVSMHFKRCRDEAIAYAEGAFGDDDG